MARGTGRKRQKRGAFGTAHKLPSGRYRAMYYGPDGRRHKADTTFLTERDARGWLAIVQADIIKNAWVPPEANRAPRSKLTFGEYAEAWLRHRDLKDRTREHYRKLLDAKILPAFGPLPIGSITSDDVGSWHAKTGNKTPTLRAHAYALLRTIMGTALNEGKIASNPCVIRGAGSARRVHKIRPASLDEIEAIAWEMPKNYRAMVLLAAWCALRFGELTELRRKDMVLVIPNDPDQMPEGTIRVDRAVVYVDGDFLLTTPKSAAGIRDVAIPPHLLPFLQHHLDEFAPGPDDLLFPAAHGGYLAPSTLYRHYYAARSKADREDLRFHDLRHSGAVLAAATGATLADLMARLGHATPASAMRYQHAAQGRDREIAALLSRRLAGR